MLTLVNKSRFGQFLGALDQCLWPVLERLKSLGHGGEAGSGWTLLRFDHPDTCLVPFSDLS